jgi:hypothetical protein
MIQRLRAWLSALFARELHMLIVTEVGSGHVRQVIWFRSAGAAARMAARLLSPGRSRAEQEAFARDLRPFAPGGTQLFANGRKSIVLWVTGREGEA